LRVPPGHFARRRIGSIRLETSHILKDRVFRPSLDGSPDSGPASWFALRTDDPKALIEHLKDAAGRDIVEHFARGDFEKWLRDLYSRPDLADGVRRLRETWNGQHDPRRELIALLQALK
jgi:hypothetical protein